MSASTSLPARIAQCQLLHQRHRKSDDGELHNVIAINHGGAAAQLYPALKKAEAQGIKVVGFDTGLPELKGHASDVLYDIPGASGKAGEMFAQIVPEGAKIGIIRCLLGNPDTDALINGFKKATESRNTTW